MAKAEAGAIASQAQGNLAFLPQFFDLLEAGHDVAAILDRFVDSDHDIEHRQIGMITRDGAGLSFTGAKCAPWAGHRIGDDFACQGNTLVGPEVVDSMVGAFEATGGRLHERLLGALVAGDEAGGDLRGKQSARLLVARAGAGQTGTDTFVDVRVEDHDEPVREVARILGVGGTLLEILGLLGEAAKAEEGAKERALDRLRAYLDDKREPRYLDWWESLASRYEGEGLIEKAVEAYRQYLSINPRMERVLRSSASRGEMTREVVDRLFTES